ncbi:hypothetical protein Tco_0072020, partial [Tanacetum coccineum]
MVMGCMALVVAGGGDANGGEVRVLVMVMGCMALVVAGGGGRSDEDGEEDGVKILAGKDRGSPEKSAGEDGGSPETSTGKVFPAAAVVDRRQLAGGGWPEIEERGERILSG